MIKEVDENLAGIFTGEEMKEIHVAGRHLAEMFLLDAAKTAESHKEMGFNIKVLQVAAIVILGNRALNDHMLSNVPFGEALTAIFKHIAEEAKLQLQAQSQVEILTPGKGSEGVDA